VDPDDEETARFHTAIQAMAARNSPEPNKATSRRLYGDLFNNRNDAVVDVAHMGAVEYRGPAAARGQPPL
jgi:hypothetical protein